MFERFTERSRMVVTMAQDFARTEKHREIYALDVLYSLTNVEGVAQTVLEETAGLDHLRSRIRDVAMGAHRLATDQELTGQIPFAPETKKMLELALREALHLGHNYIGTEHILLALVRADDFDVKTVLAGFGLDAEIIRQRLVENLGGKRRSEAAQLPPMPEQSQSVRIMPDPPTVETVFELTDDEQTHVDYVVDLLLRLNVRQWLALKSQIDQIDPPGGTFVREPRPPRSPRPGRAARISLREPHDTES